MANGKPGDYQYGVLNSIQRPQVGNSVDWYLNDPWFAIKEAVEDTFRPNALENTGPYRGIVLRVEPPTSQLDEPIDASYYIYDGQQVPDLVRIKVRVPELHTALPVPSNWGDQGVQTDMHQKIIDMYPTYTAQSDLVVTPGIGDIVWVDYTNKNDFTDPVYIRPVLEKERFVTTIAPLIGSELMKPCDKTSEGAGGTAGDVVPGINVTGAQPYPQGARKEPLGETEIVEDTALPPEAGLKDRLVRMADSVDLKVKGWIGRLPSNGGRQVVMIAPRTTDFEKRFEIAYYFHGGGSWFSANTPKFLFSNLKEMSRKGRNLILIYVQLPFSGKEPNKFSGAGGGATIAFMGGKGGSFANLHGDVVKNISSVFIERSLETEVSFVSMTAHSKGGHIFRNIAHSGDLKAVKPDKITCADSDYEHFKDGRGNKLDPGATQSLWDNYLSSAGKNVEWNLLCISPDRFPDDYPPEGKTDTKNGEVRKGNNGNHPRIAMQKVMKNVFEVDVSNREVVTEKAITNAKIFVSYVPYMKTHTQIGLDSFIFEGPLAFEEPKENKQVTEIRPETASSPESSVESAPVSEE